MTFKINVPRSAELAGLATQARSGDGGKERTKFKVACSTTEDFTGCTWESFESKEDDKATASLFEFSKNLSNIRKVDGQHWVKIVVESKRNVSLRAGLILFCT